MIYLTGRALADHLAKYPPTFEEVMERLRHGGLTSEDIKTLAHSRGERNQHDADALVKMREERDATIKELSKYAQEAGKAQGHIDALRKALRDCAAAVGATVGEECSHQFHCLVAEEVKLVVEKLKAEVERLRTYHDRGPVRQQQELAAALAERDSLAAEVERLRQQVDATSLSRNVANANLVALTSDVERLTEAIKYAPLHRSDADAQRDLENLKRIAAECGKDKQS